MDVLNLVQKLVFSCLDEGPVYTAKFGHLLKCLSHDRKNLDETVEIERSPIAAYVKVKIVYKF